MLDSLRLLFDTSDFPARWDCGNWSPLHGWFHIIGDLAIASAYAMIPLAIAGYCWAKRNELAFPKVCWLFAAFIFSCGSGHLVEAIIFYFPIYRFAAVLKVVTALVSWATVIAIIRIAPQALELPGVIRMNDQLQRQLVVIRESSAALERSNRDLEAFTGLVTHDLRNPMSGALFMAELAKESCDSGNVDLASTRLELVLGSLRQLDVFVKNLHAQAISSGPGDELSAVPLDDVLTRVIDTLSPMLVSSRASVKSESLPLVMGNETLLRQLFSNLIDNAVKYRSEQDPVIRITGESEGSHQIVRIADNGRGIPVADRVRVFQSRHRASNVGQVAGSGIGLDRCREIMTLHRGTIRVVESEKGTVFELRFFASAPRPEATKV